MEHIGVRCFVLGQTGLWTERPESVIIRAMARDEHPQIDTSVPSIARVYDFILGGKDHYAIDRTFIEAIADRWPGVQETARLNRAFVMRAVRYLAARGLSQFLDLGSGLPTQENVHQVAQRFAPGARVVYVDIDPGVDAHGRALLGADPHTRYIRADIRSSDDVIGQAAEFLDFLEPIGILCTGALHFIPEPPQQVLADYLEHLVPGSALALSHTTSDGMSAELDAELGSLYAEGIHSRPGAQILEAFAGWHLVDPGLVSVVDWRPDETVEPPLVPMLAGVAIRP